MTDLHYLSALDALAGFRSRDLSPVELMSAVIARAEVTEPAVNALAATHFEAVEHRVLTRRLQWRAAPRWPLGPISGDRSGYRHRSAVLSVLSLRTGGCRRWKSLILIIAGMRIALSVDLGCYAVDADVAASTLAAAERLRAAGAVVTPVTLPWQLGDISEAARIHFGMIFGPSLRSLYAASASELTSYARRFYEESEQVSKDEYVAGLELEGKIYAPLGALLDDYDALICPTFAIPAYPAEYDTDQEVRVNGVACGDWTDVMMTLPFNIASRCPVLSVPSGLSRDGVPTGLSIVARTYDDITAFRVAAAHESAFHLPHPPAFS